jgi:hypothetical protein
VNTASPTTDLAYLQDEAAAVAVPYYRAKARYLIDRAYQLGVATTRRPRPRAKPRTPDPGAPANGG